ncbi:DUF1501 domain-containing protein [Chitinimonas taiwanensis]|uniref:Uncharacterized conserved protein, DUF1501 family n=1 Tax=Chitinimonas taiwanensis DSM 18899 TaxID=1121279 RepID=A0A1K2HI60_9NEIS|nr:DUF1501 domain-containing protein [Chitinimonas taiwanensis]SFZ76389.1 Uncharacterized conserved protein, DUF1501 family [Chitinimonas taiwanensis DSM 18899]
MNRRDLLKALMGGSALGTFGGLQALMSIPAHAAGDPSYKALVCVQLFGGNDSANMIVPTDSRYSAYQSVRGVLALPKASLVPIGAQYGLHPALAALEPLWSRGDLGVVSNVGPLVRPTTRADLVSKTARLPDNLFSHSDQQNLWQSGGSSVLGRTGWGGRLAEALGPDPVFAFGNSGRLGIGSARSTLALPGPGSDFAPAGLASNWGGHPARKAMLQTLASTPRSNKLMNAFAGIQNTALSRSASLAPLLKVSPSNNPSEILNGPFQNLSGALDSDIARQLYQVAKMIANRQSVGGNRQVFVVAQDGYDTHENQLTRQGDLFAELGPALAAFQAAMVLLGMEDSVTTATLSDFGRTFKPNSSGGADHGWGNHQLVIGGAVQGGKLHGSFPELALGGPDDFGVNSWEYQGRWIPTQSVDQYIATLARWMGLSDAQVLSLLPNLGNFTVRNLGFV